MASIAGFRSRSQLGMRNPRSRSTNITPQHGGIAVHWGGPGQNLGSHSRCEEIWRGWQNYHMDTHGWVDIAYTAAFCNHGYVLAGRGYGTRTAANGTNHGNQNYYAFVWIGGSGNSITSKAISALEWLINDARSRGAGRRVRPHKDFTGSSCPGTRLINQAGRLDNKDISGGDDMVAPKDWDSKDIDVVRSVINNMIVKHSEANLAWHLRWILAYAESAHESTQAIAKMVDSLSESSGIDSSTLARELAEELGESLDDIAERAGKSAANVTASEIVRKHGEALLSGVSNDE